MSTPHNFVNKQDAENFFRKYFSVLNLDSEQIINGNDPSSGYTIISPNDYTGLQTLTSGASTIEFEGRLQSYSGIKIKHYELTLSLKTDDIIGTTGFKTIYIDFDYRIPKTSNMGFTCYGRGRNVSTSSTIDFVDSRVDGIVLQNACTNSVNSNELSTPLLKLYIYEPEDNEENIIFYRGVCVNYDTTVPSTRTDYFVNEYWGYGRDVAFNKEAIKKMTISPQVGSFISGSKYSVFGYQ